MLLIGKSQLVLDESVAGLRERGYKAEATNDFTDITGRFDVKAIVFLTYEHVRDRKRLLKLDVGG